MNQAQFEQRVANVDKTVIENIKRLSVEAAVHPAEENEYNDRNRARWSTVLAHMRESYVPEKMIIALDAAFEWMDGNLMPYEIYGMINGLDQDLVASIVNGPDGIEDIDE